eukprot:TRINITY_DN6020_c1_g1_i1.p1 TRINITY_DN6020_c1_g1~~TRINITY_DN6020_c1_g1_i1.p1  ORF type:complete len:758 (+),score=217.39 TRINITY_DN6020_c1_g1_i1:34-2274(+)
MAEGEAGRRRLKNRDRLKEFYGIQEDTKQPSQEPGDIDGSAFDSKAYFENLLETKNLKQLIDNDNKMFSEIKQLDSAMKRLVYDNYNKFISATETIRTMKTNVENMEDEMNRLSENMEKISSSSDQLNTTLSERRAKIEQLSSIHRLLQKLQFLTQLPSRLRKGIDLEAYSQTVKYYKTGSSILRRYSNLPSFQTILNECDAVIVDLKKILYSRIGDSKYSVTIVSESVNLLLELEENSIKLRNQYLSSRKVALEQTLNAYAKPSANSDSNTTLMKLNEAFMFNFLETYRNYDALFLEKEANAKDKESAIDILESFTRELFIMYFNITRSTMLQCKDTADLITGMQTFHSYLSQLYPSGHSRAEGMLPTVPLSKSIQHFLQDNTAEQINGIASDRLEQLFTSLQSSVRALINTAITETVEGKTLYVRAKETAEAISETIRTTLGEMRLFFAPSDGDFLSRHTSSMLAKIHVKIQQFFLYLTMVIAEYQREDQIPDTQEFGGLLILVRLLLLMDSQVIPTVSKSLDMLKQLASDDNEFTISENELHNRLKKTAESLIQHCVKLCSTKLSLMIWKGIDTANWLKTKEAKGPRSGVELVLDEIASMTKFISSAFESDKLLPTARGTPHNPRRAESQRALFDKKIQIYENVDFSKSWILTQIIKISIKAFLEYNRLKTFGRNGLQQMQVDIYFMRKVLCSLVEPAQGLFNSLFDEVMLATMERCVDPILMEESVIVTLCDIKLKKRLGEI